MIEVAELSTSTPVSSDQAIATFPMDAERRDIRRRVMDWARCQVSLPELSGGLLEGPGGDGPDLIFFAHGWGSFIYLVENDDADTLPSGSEDWLARWANSGAPKMAVFLGLGEKGSCRLLVDHLQPHLLSVPDGRLN